MNALCLKLLQTLLSRFDIPVVSIIDDDLAALHGEEVHDLIFELLFDSAAEYIRRLRPWC